MNPDTTFRPRLGAIVALCLVMLLGACGSDDNTSAGDASSSTTSAPQASSTTKTECASGTISGAGSTFVQTIVQQWIKDYAEECPGSTVNYQGVGSGAGIQQLTAGTVDFAGSDVAMKPEEQTAAESKVGPVLHIPWTAGGIAVEYNLEGVEGLKLTPETLARIFAGKITKWNDPALAADNKGVDLPSTGVQVIHRSDGSGTTAAFTAYLAAAAPSTWTFGAGKEIPWPTGQGAKGSDGVSAAVKQASGAIGYAEVSFAKGSTLGIAKIRNAGGSFVGPEGDAVADALESAKVPTDLKVEIDYRPTSAKAYPISTTSFVLVPSKPTDAAKAKLLRSFVTYALGAGQGAAEDLSYAPLPTSLADKAMTAAASIGG
ncbi:MAG TPA: phosphate ABC transporter substrate-binding protein PstS [Acidimicrobiales bacterium]|nr:phosphate ABC transporter substrate-binding protein PstS [Acidimicrobiales bacterium]